MSESARDRILDAAEQRARANGYNGFSFRDLASDVGVKSSSVHYHFPTKEDLGAALVARYAARISERLGCPDGLSPEEARARVTTVFRDALDVDDRMCLCGVFGAERDGLPEAVQKGVARFFRDLLDYLARAFGPRWQGEAPAAVIARLEGALILARAASDRSLFDKAIQ